MKRTLLLALALSACTSYSQFYPTYPCETIVGLSWELDPNDEEHPYGSFTSSYQNVCNCPNSNAQTAWIPWWCGIMEYTGVCTNGSCENTVHIDLVDPTPGVDYSCNLILTTILANKCLATMEVWPTWNPESISCSQQNPCPTASYPPYSGTIVDKTYTDCP